jgi:DNA-binding CsgD family transcriptional regulator
LPIGRHRPVGTRGRVLELVAEGLSAAKIAARLVLSRERSAATIETHAKLGVGDRVSAVVKAMRAGLIR